MPYKPGLKWLTGKWLGREIQGDEGGHDSEEDARACVDLLKLKLANGEFQYIFTDPDRCQRSLDSDLWVEAANTI